MNAKITQKIQVYLNNGQEDLLNMNSHLNQNNPSRGPQWCLCLHIQGILEGQYWSVNVVLDHLSTEFTHPNTMWFFMWLLLTSMLI